MKIEMAAHEHYRHQSGGPTLVDDSRGRTHLREAFKWMTSCKGMNQHRERDADWLLAQVDAGATSGTWVASVGFDVGINAGAPVGRRTWMLLSAYNERHLAGIVDLCDERRLSDSYPLAAARRAYFACGIGPAEFRTFSAVSHPRGSGGSGHMVVRTPFGVAVARADNFDGFVGFSPTAVCEDASRLARKYDVPILIARAGRCALVMPPAAHVHDPCAEATARIVANSRPSTKIVRGSKLRRRNARRRVNT